MPLRTSRRFLISGRVQGVGFRYFAQRVAQELGVAGWARNLADGRVEVHGTGRAADLDHFEARLRMGPAHSDVRGFEVQQSSPEEPGRHESAGFHIR
jgi:acylphosphatase